MKVFFQTASSESCSRIVQQSVLLYSDVRVVWRDTRIELFGMDKD